MNTPAEPRDYYTDVPFRIDARLAEEELLISSIGCALHFLTNDNHPSSPWEQRARTESLRYPLHQESPR